MISAPSAAIRTALSRSILRPLMSDIEASGSVSPPSLADRNRDGTAKFER